MASPVTLIENDDGDQEIQGVFDEALDDHWDLPVHGFDRVEDEKANQEDGVTRAPMNRQRVTVRLIDRFVCSADQVSKT